MPNEAEPLWLGRDECVEINRLIVNRTGEPHLVLDEALLVSAIHRPQNQWHYEAADVQTMAVTLMLSIARNHPFRQGNKRTGFIGMIEFLARNDHSLQLMDSSRVGDMVVDTLTRRWTDDQPVEALRPFIVPL